MSEPTSQQCSDGATLSVDADGVEFATWYPQMGGYVGKAVVSVSSFAHDGGCFEAEVWHDGDFAFGSEMAPARLHHCMPCQFVYFAVCVVAKKLEAGPPNSAEDFADFEQSVLTAVTLLEKLKAAVPK